MKTRIIGAAIAALILFVITLAAMNWEEINRGLSLPGQVGTAADLYFFNGEQSVDSFHYWTFSLADGSQWKAVQADTAAVASKPSWLIVISQGPTRETYIYEGRYDVELQSKLQHFFNETAQQKPTPDDYFSALREMGFHQTAQ